MGVYTVNQTDGSLVRVAGETLYADASIGAIQSYGGETAPAGWLICDGSTLSRTDYAELFAVIGTNFGEGDGETTFGIPDLRECVPVGAGKNITQSITNHDRYNLGQFKDDELGTHDHPLKTVTTATYNTAGVPVGVANNNTPTSATHGKQLGVNYIIKAKMVALPADLEAQVDVDYQKKDLTQAVESQTTVEGALGALSTNKQAKTLTTSVESQTTVEGALGALSTNKAAKVSNSTNGDLAALDANGNLVDSGVSKDIIPSDASASNKLMTVADITPIGVILPYGGATAPNKWLLCQGQAVSRTTYSKLFAVIGTAFGSGNGSTTFNLPDMRESVPKGAGLTGKTVGAHLDADGLAVGEFIDDRIKAHSHRIMTYSGSQTSISNVYGNTGIASNIDASDSMSYVTNVTRNGSKGPIIESTGSATAEVKSVGVNYIIKAL